MSEHFVFLPLLIPFAAAVALLPLARRTRLQRVIAASAVLLLLLVCARLVVALRSQGLIVYEMGGWPAPYGIVFAVDLFVALLMLMGAITAAASLFFAFGSVGPQKERYFFYPLLLFLVAAVNGALMTGDIFNLYVFFELILISSYLLFSHGGRAGQLKESFKFVLLNMISSAFLLVGIGGLYALTGTLNMADLAVKVAALPDKRIAAALAAVFMFSLGVKAAMVPLFFWLPRAYGEVATPVAALSAAVSTKVGVYALYRVFTLIFIHHVEYTHKAVLMALAVLTMVIGVLGAIAQMNVKRLLAFHIVSQIGYMLFGLAMLSVAGLAGGIMHIMFNMIIKPALFLVAGATEQVTGTADLRKMSGVIHRAPALAFTFLAGGLGLAGVPPMSGFISKVTLFYAGFLGGHYLATAVAVGVSFLTLFSMIKIFRMAYWGPQDGLPSKQLKAARGHGLLLAPGAALVAAGLVMGLGGSYLIDYADAAARWLMHPAWYVAGVLGESSAQALLAALEVVAP